jgi:VWFA-related protein
VASFQAYSTDLPEGVETFAGEVDVTFPGRYQSRTVVQVAVLASVGELVPEVLGNFSAYDLLITGELLKEGTLHDNFRVQYKFASGEVADQIAAAEAGAGPRDGAGLPLIFERRVRQGTYDLILRIEDLGSGRMFRYQEVLEVPEVTGSVPPPPLNTETARILAEANAALRSGETTVNIAPLAGEWQTGLVRIDAMTTGTEIESVTFLLDGDAVLTKRSPPYSVELDLGAVPRARTLRVEAHDAAKEEVAADQVLLNGGRHRFAIQLVEPRRGKHYSGSLRAEAQAQAPEGEGIARVEFYLNETLVATVFQPPYVQPIVLPKNEMVAYVRAVAYTPDGSATEELVFINAPDNVESLDINYVEMFTTVLDGAKRPVEGMTAEDFIVVEDGVAQEIARFEQVRDLPIHAAIMLDVSASMESRLAAAQGAALAFFEQAITPKDRATVITFNDHPNLAVTFTNDTTALAAGLAGLKAERGTALWDSLIYTLYYFNGVKGQRTVLLLSDGKDESSKFDWDDAIEYARRAGVTIYAIGLDLSRGNLDARGKLNKLAAETGGRTFFIEQTSELASVYEAIQRELRSRYLITYQSSNVTGSKKFRSVELDTRRRGLQVKTMRGYYP